MAKDSEANSKEWNNGLIMLSWATTVYTYPFVLKCQCELTIRSSFSGSHTFSLTASPKIGPDPNSFTFVLVTARFWP